MFFPEFLPKFFTVFLWVFLLRFLFKVLHWKLPEKYRKKLAGISRETSRRTIEEITKGTSCKLSEKKTVKLRKTVGSNLGVDMDVEIYGKIPEETLDTFERICQSKYGKNLARNSKIYRAPGRNPRTIRKNPGYN